MESTSTSTSTNGYQRGRNSERRKGQSNNTRLQNKALKTTTKLSPINYNDNKESEMTIMIANDSDSYQTIGDAAFQPSFIEKERGFVNNFELIGDNNSLDLVSVAFKCNQESVAQTYASNIDQSKINSESESYMKHILNTKLETKPNNLEGRSTTQCEGIQTSQSGETYSNIDRTKSQNKSVECTSMKSNTDDTSVKVSLASSYFLDCSYKESNDKYVVSDILLSHQQPTNTINSQFAPLENACLPTMTSAPLRTCIDNIYVNYETVDPFTQSFQNFNVLNAYEPPRGGYTYYNSCNHVISQQCFNNDFIPCREQPPVENGGNYFNNEYACNYMPMQDCSSALGNDFFTYSNNYPDYASNYSNSQAQLNSYVPQETYHYMDAQCVPNYSFCNFGANPNSYQSVASNVVTSPMYSTPAYLPTPPVVFGNCPAPPTPSFPVPVSFPMTTPTMFPPQQHRPAIQIPVQPPLMPQPNQMLTEIPAPHHPPAPRYPYIFVSESGLITVQLKNDISVEMTLERSIRLVNHGKHLVVATNGRGSASCLYHPGVRVCQEGTNTDAEIYGERKAHMTTDFIQFSSRDRIYRFNYEDIYETKENAFVDISRDHSIDLLFSGDSCGKNKVSLCHEATRESQCQYFPYGGFALRINGIKVTQTDLGDVIVTSWPKYLKIATGNTYLHVETHFSDISVDKNWSVRVSRGAHVLRATPTDFILSNGRLCAGVTSENEITVYNVSQTEKDAEEKVRRWRPNCPKGNTTVRTVGKRTPKDIITTSGTSDVPAASVSSDSEI